MRRAGVAVVVIASLFMARPDTFHADAGRPHLALVLEAAAWIRAAAVRQPSGLAWPAVPGAAGEAGVPAVDLYSGSAGVVLFFLQLHQATGRPEPLADARAGADALVAAVPAMRDTGLYSGLAGVGVALMHAARVTGEARYRDGARAVVRAIAARATPAGAGVEWNDVTDIISGSAGTGLFLLEAARTLDMPEARELAARAGRRLVELGRSARGGRAWAMSRSVSRELPNFSHGTAGVAFFLATLARDTGDRRFLDAALEGARYLQAIADVTGDMCLIAHHPPEAGEGKLYYLGWCHGPAGTARLWYRLWQVTGDRSWLDWLRTSARAMLASGIPERQTPGFWNNAGQCCGTAGVAQFFLDYHRATGDAEALAFARRLTAALVRQATRDAAGARWIHAEHRVKPEDVHAQTGWMQGAAGIGAWLLQLDAFDRGAPVSFALPDSPF